MRVRANIRSRIENLFTNIADIKINVKIIDAHIANLNTYHKTISNFKNDIQELYLHNFSDEHLCSDIQTQKFVDNTSNDRKILSMRKN